MLLYLGLVICFLLKVWNMRTRIKKNKSALILTALTVLLSMFIGFQDCICTYLMGFPIPFYVDSVGCRRSEFPVDFIALLLNFTLHFACWKFMEYLINDFGSMLIDINNFLRD